MFQLPEQFRFTVRKCFDHAILFQNQKSFEDAKRICKVYNNEPEKAGVFFIPAMGKKEGLKFWVLASSGEGWEHVSVSIYNENRCPTWIEMCYIKDLFWTKDTATVQYHPAEKDYVSNHEFCLHIWRPTNQTLPVPKAILVGIPNKY